MKKNLTVRPWPRRGLLAAAALAAGGLFWTLRPAHTDPAPAQGALQAGAQSPKANTPATASAPVPDEAAVASDRSPLARAETLEERWLEAPNGATEFKRVRLARLVPGGPLLRLVDTFRLDENGEPQPLGTEAMRADAVLVGVPATVEATVVADQLREAGFAVESPGAADAVVVVVLPEATLDGVPTALAELAARLPGLTADPDFIRFSARIVSDDFDATRLWGLEKIEAPAAWTVSTGSEEVVVAVIDSGITVDHPDLKTNLWANPGEIDRNGRDDDGNGFVDDIHGWNFAGNNAALADLDDHGTHVAGTIGAAGNNTQGVVGVNWRVRLMALRAGSESYSDSALLNALRYTIRQRQRGVRLVAVNMSLGGLGFSSVFRQELIAARDAGLLVVAAAGNLSDTTPERNNDITPVYPASYDVDNVIAVASTNQGDNLSYFSHYGATSVDLAAPGTAVLSTIRNGAYARNNGTSMAAPHVAGAIALVASVEPSLNAAQLRARILDTVDVVPLLAGRLVTSGRLNLRRAVAPDLIPPRVIIARQGAPVEVAALDRAGLALDLEARLQGDRGVLPSATLAWSTAAGPAQVAFSTPAGGTTTALFPAEGRYRIRVTATAGLLAEVDELVVAVGPDRTVAQDGLQGWWRFDDSGTTTGDASGQGRTGTLLGAQRSSTAVLGTAMAFAGTGDTVSFASPSLSRLTIAGWARASGVNSATIFPRVVHMREGLLFGGFDVDRSSLDDGNFNTLKFALDQVGASEVWHSPPGSFQIGRWYHVAVTYDPLRPNPAPVFYIDGVRQITGIQSSTPVTTPTSPAGVGFIGDRGDTTRGWLGQLDQIRLYSATLSDADVAWMSREVTLEALAGGTPTAVATADPFRWTLGFVPAATGLTQPSLGNPRWSDLDGRALFTDPGAVGTEVLLTRAGRHTLRFDATSSDGVHVSRVLEVDVNAPAVAREGYYAGNTSVDGRFILVVRADGTATFLGSAARGSFQRDFVVPEAGVFDIADRAGNRVLGRIRGDGTVEGTLFDGVVPAAFAGGRVSVGFGDADPSRDGLYSGWLVDSGVRGAALVERGRIALVLEESGAQGVIDSALDEAGGFVLSPAAGVSYAGLVGAERITARVVSPGRGERELVLLREGYTPARRLLNLSVRGFVGTGGEILIPGFVIAGGDLPVLVRGIGPGLAALDVPAPILLPRPDLALRLDGTVVRENRGWDSDGQRAVIEAANDLTGAFPLETGAADAAFTLSLAPALYTVWLRGVDEGTGVGLAEIYDAGNEAAAGRLVNLSGRGFVGTGDATMIGGFVVDGDAPVLVLVRAAGPGLRGLGVDGVLEQPRLRVVRGTAEIATGGAWELADNAATLAAAAEHVGAFAFESGSADAALLLSLPPGPYTAQVFGGDGGTGVALLEIYRVDGM